MTLFRKAVGAGLVAMTYQLHFDGPPAREFVVAALIYLAILVLVPAKDAGEPSQ